MLPTAKLVVLLSYDIEIQIKINPLDFIWEL